MTIEIGDNLLTALPELRAILYMLSMLVPVGLTTICCVLVAYASDIVEACAGVVRAWRNK